MARLTKFTKIATLALIICSQAGIAFPKDNKTRRPVEVASTKSHKGHRPKAPSRQHIECFYEEDSLHFQFTIPEGHCSLVVTDVLTGISLTYDFDSDVYAIVHVGELSSANIEITTSNGNIYEGELE